MEYKSLEATLESFGIDPEYVESAYDLDSIESIPDFIEWLEKTNGDVQQSFRLYGLGARFPAPDEPEEIAAWWEWSRHDPTNPTEFTCPGCMADFVVVEAEGGNYWGTDTLALSDRGHLDDFRPILDPSDNLYNYEVADHPDTKYSHVCGSCERSFQGVQDGDRKNKIRYHDKDGMVDVDHEGHVAHRETGYFDLPRSTRETLDEMIQYRDPEGWVQVFPDGPPDARVAHIRNNVNRWLSSWSTGRKSDQDEYHFDFPSIIRTGIRRGMYISGSSLWVPDDPAAIKEAREWIEGPASEYRR